MLTDDQKYQNIIAQIHELNRQNLLAENEKNDIILNKLISLEEKINNPKNDDQLNLFSSNSIVKKAFYIIVMLLILNIFLNIIQLFNNSNTVEQTATIQEAEESINNRSLEKKDQISQEQLQEVQFETNSQDQSQSINEDVVIFEQSSENEITHDDLNESFEEIKPIIKKDTTYTCEDDGFQAKHKIPYTVEVKGKLYNDKFEFILQNNSSTKKCRINKEDI